MEAFFSDHSVASMNHISVLVRLKLDARLADIDWVRYCRADGARRDGRGKVDRAGLGGSHAIVRNKGAQFPLQHLVDGYVQARIGGIADGSCAKTGEEAPDACLVTDVFDSGPHGWVGIESRLKPDLDDSQRHQHKACPCPCHGARHHVGRIAQLRQ